MNKTLTISIAAYNVANYLDECLSSLCLNNNIEKLEVIVVDDGSSDSTYQKSKEYILAKKTYGFGFHIISLGKWNAKQIEDICNVTENVDTIDFPYEPKEYTFKERDFSDYEKRKNFKIAVYTKSSGRRIPIITQVLLKNTCDELKKHTISLMSIFMDC